MAKTDLKTKDPRTGTHPQANRSRPLLLIARLAGGAILLASAALHASLIDGGFAGVLLGLAALVAAILAIGVLTLDGRPALLLGVPFLAIASLVQIVGSIAGTGYHESLAAPFATLSPFLHVGGLLLLLIAAALLARGSRAKVGSRRSKAHVMEIASLVPGPNQRTTEPIKWPAERAQRAGLAAKAEPSRRSKKRSVEPAPSPQAKPSPSGEPISWRGSPLPAAPAPKAVAKPVAEPAAAASAEPEVPEFAQVSETPPADHVIRWRRPAVQPAVTVAETPAPAPATPAATEQAAPAAPAAEVAPEPAPVPAEDGRDLFIEPVSLAVAEPYYRLLVREREILMRLEGALGLDDPRALRSRTVIAAYYIAGGEFVRGVELQEMVAADCARIHGEDHPHTVDARAKLAQWRKLAKKQRRAKASVG